MWKYPINFLHECQPISISGHVYRFPADTHPDLSFVFPDALPASAFPEAMRSHLVARFVSKSGWRTRAGKTPIAAPEAAHSHPYVVGNDLIFLHIYVWTFGSYNNNQSDATGGQLSFFVCLLDTASFSLRSLVNLLVVPREWLHQQNQLKYSEDRLVLNFSVLGCHMMFIVKLWCNLFSSLSWKKSA